MTLDHDQKHAASLTHEQRSEIRSEARKTALLWAIAPLVMAALSLGLVAKEQLDTSHQIEMDTVRSELSDIDHRIKQERCVIDPINQVIRQRIEDRTDSPRFRLCDSDEALPDLMARRDRLDARLREMGAYEERDG